MKTSHERMLAKMKSPKAKEARAKAAIHGAKKPEKVEGGHMLHKVY